MPAIPGHDGRLVDIRYSRGSKVPYVVLWEDNVLPPPEGSAWPSSLLKHVNGYVARRSWFSAEDAAVLAARLGRISKFQSLKSEDAVTWSWFGTLGLAAPEDRRATVQCLYDRVGLSLRASDVVIDQWSRVLHPNAAASSKGPELDARIQDAGTALIYVEAKWDAAIGTGKGSVEGIRDDQVVLRRESLRTDPALGTVARKFVVLGISNGTPDLTVYDEAPAGSSRRPVKIAWLTWDDLATCEVHPRADEFRRYLDWKRNLTKGAV